MNVEKLTAQVKRIAATRAKLELAVDPERAVRCLARALDRLSYLGGSFGPHPDGVYEYRYFTDWENFPSSFPAGCWPTAALITSRELAKAIGARELERIAWHPAYCRARGVPQAGPKEWSLLHRATRAADESVWALAEMTVEFLSPSNQ